MHAVTARFLLVLVCAPFAGPIAAEPTSRIAWKPCFEEFGFPYQCGTVHVPLDHDAPGVATVAIALIRLPAGDPQRRIGSIVFNPGGPGGSGVDFILGNGPYLYTPELRARFDLVGFDPRGIARSKALRCFGNPGQWEDTFTPFAFPITPEERAIRDDADRHLSEACARRGSRILDHMATADVARDLELLRGAVGDEGLRFVGYSYGSYLGVTYANLFPDKVRAVVVDGVLDPVAWATGDPGEGETIPFSTRIRAADGALDTLNEFFRLCDGSPSNCAIAGESAARFAALADALRAAPIPIASPDGTVVSFTYQDLIGTSLSALYYSPAWPHLASFLAAIEASAPPAETGARWQALWRELGLIGADGFPHYPNDVEGYPGVACTDSDNPDGSEAWWSTAWQSEDESGYFGPIWTYASSACALWPGLQAGRFTGPFTASTANPLLVVGTRFDPATRYEGAQAVAALMPGSRLLTRHGWGHVAFFLSLCADRAVARYLLDGTLPAEGTVCHQDFVPFSDFGRSSAAAGARRAELLPLLIPDVVRSVLRRPRPATPRPPLTAP